VLLLERSFYLVKSELGLTTPTLDKNLESDSLDWQELVVHEPILDGALFVLVHVDVHVPNQLKERQTHFTIWPDRNIL